MRRPSCRDSWRESAGASLTREHQLVERSASMGETISQRFRALQEKCGLIADVRGAGAMQAMEFCHDRDPARPAGEVVKAIIGGCYEDGLLVITAGAHANVIRTLPPLTMSDEQLARALDVLEKRILQHAVG